eukprot:TRINITY_DN1420_c0_g1_i1.p1 TRINITY_DN1420_c0_g1~~TRINITY_DN1420_c0_g1_i1.p1  ORF type:complete len:434 (+),score=147.97 TRINITY_DN1420_c0_g1_i1:1091-2392(+)
MGFYFFGILMSGELFQKWEKMKLVKNAPPVPEAKATGAPPPPFKPMQFPAPQPAPAPVLAKGTEEMLRVMKAKADAEVLKALPQPTSPAKKKSAYEEMLETMKNKTAAPKFPDSPPKVQPSSGAQEIAQTMKIQSITEVFKQPVKVEKKSAYLEEMHNTFKKLQSPEPVAAPIEAKPSPAPKEINQAVVEPEKQQAVKIDDDEELKKAREFLEAKLQFKAGDTLEKKEASPALIPEVAIAPAIIHEEEKKEVIPNVEEAKREEAPIEEHVPENKPNEPINVLIEVPKQEEPIQENKPEEPAKVEIEEKKVEAPIDNVEAPQLPNADIILAPPPIEDKHEINIEIQQAKIEQNVEVEPPKENVDIMLVPPPQDPVGEQNQPPVQPNVDDLKDSLSSLSDEADAEIKKQMQEDENEQHQQTQFSQHEHNLSLIHI